MYMVRKQSRSGGAEYLVERVLMRSPKFRWGKVAIESVHMFNSKAAARRNAKIYGGKVASALI